MWGLNFGRGISRKVVFDPSCVYDLVSNDRDDWNKLFGVCSLRGPHHTSYRFGWRYNAKTDLIELAAYWYQRGVRGWFKLGEVSHSRPYNMQIKRKNKGVEWVINGQRGFALGGELPLIGWKLGPYFGGNNPAPKNMQIEIR